MELGEESIPSGEAEAIAKVIEASKLVLDRESRPIRRGQHPKHHGCVHAEFRVLAVPPEFRVGLFAEEAIYPALVRFSNGSQFDDRKPDAHGMAIKILNVPGRKLLEDEAEATTHDFVLVDNPVFFIPNAIDYAVFSCAMARAKGKASSRVNASLFFLPAKLRQLATLSLLYFLPSRLGQLPKLLHFAGKKPANPLHSRYWSATPYQLGEGNAVKYAATPDTIETELPGSPSADYLREAMVATLNSQDVTFEFGVQLQVDAGTMPVEDPSIEWDTRKSGFISVARIVIPRQAFDSEVMRTVGENLSYTPWHALPEHRPLGGINRTRKAVYRAMSTLRHDQNGIPRVEPTEMPSPPLSPRPEPATMPEPASIVDVMRAELDSIKKRRDHSPRLREGEQDRPSEEQAEQARLAIDPRITQEKGGASSNPVEAPGSDGAIPNPDAEMMKLRVEMLDRHVTGLAISGGGIRSGTFGIGFLQGLARLRLLRRLDYLSTVSGGGYAGSWFAAWLKREGDVKNVERQLDFGRISQAESERIYFDWKSTPKSVVDEEPEPLRHLRAYSSYLFPRPGPLSTDTWTVIAIWVRNVAINLLMLFPVAMLAVLFLRLAVFFFNYLNAEEAPNEAGGWFFAWSFLALGLVAAGVAFANNSQAVPEFRTKTASSRPPRVKRKAILTLIATLVAAFSLTVCSRWLLWHFGEWAATWKGGPGSSSPWGLFLGLITSNLGLLQPPSFLFIMGSFALFMMIGSIAIGWKTGTFALRFVGASAMAGLSSGFLFVLVLAMIRLFARQDRPDLMATFAVPGALGVVLASLIVEVAVAGRSMKEGEREWWARYGAGLGIAAVLWLIGMGATLYLPALFLAGGTALRLAIASGWLGTTALGVVTGRFVLPKLQGRGGGQTLAKLAGIAPPIFLIGMLGGLGLLASLLLNVPGLNAPQSDGLTPFAYYLEGIRGTDGRVIVVLLYAFAVFAGLGFWLIDVNLFSLNAMYANRLIRCYLGASRPMPNWADRWAKHDRTMNAGAPSISERTPMPPTRDANPVTGFDPEDDIPLSELEIGKLGPTARVYWGPHLLINTTINLVAGQDLAWRDRKGDSFTLSSLYCGSKSVGYARLGDDAESRENLTLGRAMAISGAAVDPNMKYYQSAALTALLSLFNARLGAWMQNPWKGNWKAGTPKFGGLLLTELFGGTDGSGDYIHLSDGGHFENLGVYELVRRRCRYIIALDAGEELTASGSNLATLVRLCRIDFGIRIQVDTEPPKPVGPDRISRTHVSVGRIRYDDADQGQLPGVLVYIRISMTGDEPPDLQNYASQDTNFPYQPTDFRQSFDEEQFECYRCLGDHIATEVFMDAVGRVHDKVSEIHEEYVPRLFSALQARWDQASGVQDAEYVESTRPWIALQRDLRADPNLARLSHELYPELPPAPAPLEGATSGLDADRAEFHVVCQMIQIMENTWLTLGLRGSSDLPMNRGWVNVFRRWVNTSAFQKVWPVVRTEYGSDFVRFCQEELHLRARDSRVVAYLDMPRTSDITTDAAIKLLSEEFRREWPDPPIPPSPRIPSLDQFIERAKLIGQEGQHPIWFVVQDVNRTPGRPPEQFVTGLILAAKITSFEADFPECIPPASAVEPGKPDSIELLVWMRCGDRSSSLGSPCVREVLDVHLPAALGVTKAELPALWTRYPSSGDIGDHDTEREIWLNFFARFDFRRVYPPRAGDWKYTLLKRP